MTTDPEPTTGESPTDTHPDQLDLLDYLEDTVTRSTHEHP